MIDRGANPNCKDEDDSTPCHCASQFGNLETLAYLLKSTKADTTIKNKFGYVASDISMNLETRQLFGEYASNNVKNSEQLGLAKSNSYNPQYGRTAFNGVLRHNDRVNTVTKLMSTY